jgi:hypothetical protein
MNDQYLTIFTFYSQKRVARKLAQARSAIPLNVQTQSMTLRCLIIILFDHIILQITGYMLPYIYMYAVPCQKALKTGIITAILLVTVILTIQQQVQIVGE